MNADDIKAAIKSNEGTIRGLQERSKYSLEEASALEAQNAKLKEQLSKLGSKK